MLYLSYIIFINSKVSLAWCNYLEEHAPLVLGEVPLQHVPEPADDAVRVVEPAVVLRVAPQVAQVQRHVVAAHQPLQLGGRGILMLTIASLLSRTTLDGMVMVKMTNPNPMLQLARN